MFTRGSRLLTIVAVLCLLNDVALGALSEKFCAILLAQGASEARIETVRQRAERHFYRDLSPELREKLSKAALLSMLTHDELGRPIIAEVEGGPTGLMDLWLLSASDREVPGIIFPYLQNYFESRLRLGIEQGLGRISAETVRYPTFEEHCANPRLVNDLIELERMDCETNPFILYHTFEVALLSGNDRFARQVLEYLLRLEPVGYPAIYGLERMGDQEGLLRLGISLFEKALSVFSATDSSSFGQSVSNILTEAVNALSRVKIPPWKERAEEALLYFAGLLSKESYYASLDRSDEHEFLDLKQSYFDVTLRAARGTGNIVSRYFTESEQIELVTEVDPDSRAAAVIREIADRYVSELTYRMDPGSFEELRLALKSIGEGERLRRYGKSFYDKRFEWREDHNPYLVYETAIEFLLAGGDQAGARAVLDSYLKEFEFEGRVNTENQLARDPQDLEGLFKYAYRAGHTQFVLTTIEMANKGLEVDGGDPTARRAWGRLLDAATKTSEGGVPFGVGPLIELDPEIPVSLWAVLDREKIYREMLRGELPVAPALWEATVAKGDTALISRDIIGAIRRFVQARAVGRLIQVGDQLTSQIESDPRLRHWAELATTAYSLAALLSNNRPAPVDP